MKKNYLFTLMLLFFASISYGQNLLTNGDLESWDNDTKPTGWAKAEALNKNTDSHGGSFSAFRNGGSGTKDLAQTITGIESGASYTISLWYKVTAGDNTDARIWSYWKAGGANLSDNAAELRGPNNTYFDNNGGVWTEYSTTITAPATADKLYFEVRSYSGSKVYWDDLSVVKNAAVTPALSITAPTEGATIPSSNVNVTLSVQNFNVASGSTGDGYIKYTVDGGTAIDKFDTSEIALTGLTNGAHKVEVELVNNSGASLNPIVKKEVNFTVSSYTQVANLAALRASTQNGFYELTGEVVLTYDAGGSRNQKYIQDATGAILIDDTAGKITTTYNRYDGITGIKGKLTSFSGVKQFVPQEDPGTATSTGNTITAQEVSLATLKANMDDYESEWVKITAASFDTADGTVVFEARKNYDISKGTDKMVFRTNFTTADYIGSVIPSGEHSITGIAGRYNSTMQIYATALTDIVALNTKINIIENFGIYPNPVADGRFTITSASTSVKNVIIYNILGKQVLTIKAEGTTQNIDVKNLKTGVYILKVEENGKTATKKIVIK